MAKGIEWDTYRPDMPAPEPETPKQQPPQRIGTAKDAPGPPIAECDECGEPANPRWTDQGLNFCRSCVPDALRYPTRKP